MMDNSNLPPGCTSYDGGIDHSYETAIEQLTDAVPNTYMLMLLAEIAPHIEAIYDAGFNDGKDEAMLENSLTPRDMHKYPIGTKYMTRGNAPRECTIIDQLTTINSKGEIVNRRYVATHAFMGQIVTDYDVVDTTIARGLIK